jgi:hypothetical protein
MTLPPQEEEEKGEEKKKSDAAAAPAEEAVVRGCGVLATRQSMVQREGRCLQRRRKSFFPSIYIYTNIKRHKIWVIQTI